MRETLSFGGDEVAPDRAQVLRLQGIPPTATLPERVEGLLESAITRLAELMRPVAVVSEISKAELRDVYRGDGHNDVDTPLAGIFPRADRLALFAATLGESLSAQVEKLFEDGDLAGAVMLDSAASAAAERLVQRIEARFSTALGGSPASAVLAYSPGYCGWHVSGQRALFASLEPTEVGITLNASCLMRPLKSVSGVLVAGSPEIHDFDDDFPCCSLCSTRECRDRIQRVRNETLRLRERPEPLQPGS